ncbi:MAG: hypothetical protein IJ728_08110 [Selenomonadaceae bacterium]|nr:hypothetical protein [Selenomonadaceae bacterium]
MKKKYSVPKVINMPQEIQSGVPGALLGAAYMIGRAVTAAVKGHIDLKAGMNEPKTLQSRK